MESLLIALIWLLIYALVLAVIIYVVVRLLTQFVPGAAPYAWLVWCIGGLVLVLLALRLFAPLIGA